MPGVERPSHALKCKIGKRGIKQVTVSEDQKERLGQSGCTNKKTAARAMISPLYS